MNDKLAVDVWSDVACPWCWVGKRHLEQAAAQFEHEIEVVWHAFELDPSAPAEVPAELDVVQRLADKYGASRAGAQAMVDRMTSVGAERGLEFHFDRVRPVNTFDAHRLLHWAAAEGKQDALKERLFEAYMHEGRVVSDHEVLVELAADVGLDPERAQALLSTNALRDEVRDDERVAHRLGVRGVPFFVLGGRVGVSGAQPPDVLLEAMRHAWSEAHPSPETDDAEACGPDGCAV